MAYTTQIQESDLPDEMIETARASGNTPLAYFENRLDDISELADGVENGNQAAALAYLVQNANEDVVAFADNAGNVDDASFDLREHTG